jgi:SAM-dependent methyltransferase
LRNNNFDLRFIAGAKCLDAGCGGGRYSIALHKLGAAHVTGVDIGIEAINDAKRRRDALSISEDKIQFQNQSVLELPPEWDATFDFMVSNGVLHHTTDPKKGLHELSRVLRPGGKLFIMLYGSDSLEWALTDYLRDLLTGISEGEVRSVLSILDLPVGKIFHIMDRWFVPNYELIPAKEFEKRAKAAGFSKCIPMHRGLYLYDGSERKWRFPEDADIVGEGEIRYIVEK